MAINITSFTITDTNVANTGLPENVFIDTSDVSISISVEWSDIPDRTNPYPYITCFFLANSESSGEYALGESSIYTLLSSEKNNGAHTFVITPNTADQNIGWDTTFGHFTCDLEVKIWTGQDTYQSAEDGFLEFDKYEYTQPSFPSVIVSRCNADGTDNATGTYAKADISYAITSLGDNNTKNLVLKYRQLGIESWSSDVEIDLSLYQYTDSVDDYIISGATFLANSSYDFLIILSDLINDATNSKVLQAADAFIHFSADKTQVAFGKYCESTGTGFDKPGFDVNLTARFRDPVQFDFAPTILSDQKSDFLALIMPWCKLSAPTSESMTYNSAIRCWVYDFQTVERNDNDSYDILLGGTSGTRKMGFVIPEDGVYRILIMAKFSQSSTSSTAFIGFGRFASTWSTPTANYVARDVWTPDAIETNELFILPTSTTITVGQATFEIIASAGDKIWPYAALNQVSKTINSVGTWVSIQRIG